MAFANVSLCSRCGPAVLPTSPMANGSGAFWIAGIPGVDNLTVSYTDFVTTSRPVNVTSDGWIWVGVVQLDEYAYLSGTVIGLPSGIPVEGANVSACSTLAFSEGAVICAYATLTTALGQFFLAIPAGNYIIQVNATLYNSTFLPLQLLARRDCINGTHRTRTVRDRYRIRVRPGYAGVRSPAVSLTACPTWESGNCTSA